MKAWRLHGKGGPLVLEDVPKPLPRPGGVVVKMEAAPVLSYMRQVLDGTLGYALPAGPFIPGTNGIGVLDAVALEAAIDAAASMRALDLTVLRMG